MLRRFKKNEAVWVDYIRFLVEHKCHKVLSQDGSACIGLFPRNMLVWKAIAYNEFENNNDSLSARSILQKCLRLNSDLEEAYLALFVFELKFAEKIVLRREKLNSLGKLKIIEEETEKEQELESDDVLDLKIPELVWKEGLNKFDKFGFSKKCLTALYKYGSKLSFSRLEANILEFFSEEQKECLHLSKTVLQEDVCFLSRLVATRSIFYLENLGIEDVFWSLLLMKWS